MMGREPGAPLTHPVAREACERIGASALIEGSVSAVGRTTVVALSASDCTTGDTIARDQVEVERKEDVLKAVGVIASSMRRSLGESGRSLEQHNVPIQEATTPSLDALKAFTAGVEKRAAGSESSRYHSSSALSAWTATSPWRIPRSRASTAGSGKRVAVKTTRDWRTNTARRSASASVCSSLTSTTTA